jgi:hypothetical protein
MRHKAIYKTHPDVVTISGNRAYDNDGNEIALDQDLILNKIAELEAAEPLRLLRIQRNQLLQETDWTQNRDVTLANDAEWAAYRQSLRDLPNTATPELDEYGNLTNVTWPEKPA